MTPSEPRKIKSEEEVYEIQFLDSILHYTFAGLLPDKHEYKETGINVSIDAQIFHHQVQALLQIEYILITDASAGIGYNLRFGIMGSLQASENMPDEELAHYAKIHSLTFLWPYAREYTSDLIRRMSIDAPTLPIINPQFATKSLVENSQVQVNIIEE